MVSAHIPQPPPLAACRFYRSGVPDVGRPLANLPRRRTIRNRNGSGAGEGQVQLRTSCERPRAVAPGPHGNGRAQPRSESHCPWGFRCRMVLFLIRFALSDVPVSGADIAGRAGPESLHRCQACELPAPPCSMSLRVAGIRPIRASMTPHLSTWLVRSSPTAVPLRRNVGHCAEGESGAAPVLIEQVCRAGAASLGGGGPLIPTQGLSLSQLRAWAICPPMKPASQQTDCYLLASPGRSLA